MPELPGKKKPELAIPPELISVPEQINTLASRVRLIEERTGELRKMIKLVEENVIKHWKKTGSDIKTMNADMNELKRAVITVQDRIEAVINEVKLRAKKEDMDILKRYVEMWNLVKFTTNDQVEKIVEEKLTELRATQPELFPAPEAEKEETPPKAVGRLERLG